MDKIITLTPLRFSVFRSIRKTIRAFVANPYPTMLNKFQTPLQIWTLRGEGLHLRKNRNIIQHGQDHHLNR
jgi:hypothetical protein